MKAAELKEMFSKLTLDQKIAQLLQLYGGYIVSDAREVVTGPLSELELDEETLRNIGSSLNATGAEEVIKIQDSVLSNSAHAIPLAFMADICNGYKTVFPIPLGQGASWEPELIEECCRVSAKEASAAGVMVTYSPMVDLVRDARWGRVSESAGGEDPYLGEVYARAFVNGYHNHENIENNNESLAVCVKHFAAYGACEAGRDYNTVDISERELRQYYLPSYKAAVDAGCEMVMTSFNIYNGIPASANQFLMRGILRGEWGFDGAVVSDYAAVGEIVTHGAAENLHSAAEKAMLAGVDIDMMTGAYVNNLKTLVNEGKVDERLIDEAVMRLLLLKNKLGLFENPYRGADPEKEKRICLSPEHRAIARKMAAKSCVLLKNESNTLPISKEVKKIALIGPFSGSPDISGSWNLFGEDLHTVTLYAGIKSKAPEAELITSAGCITPEISAAKACGYEIPEDAGHNSFDEEYELQKAVTAAKTADIVLLTLGESGIQSGEGASRGNISLPPEQLRLLDEITKLGKKTAVILFSGRPLELKEANEKAGAIIAVWFPGTEGGNGIADILFGDENPSGHITMSFPYSVGQCPIYYNAYKTGRPNDYTRFSSRYIDMPNEPLFPFGYGLSYSSFMYGEIQFAGSNTLTDNSTLLASVSIKNTSTIAGYEVVQMYICDISASVVRPVKELKGFCKVLLQPGEEKIVSFEIKEEMLRFWDSNMNYNSEKGKFKLYIGGNSRDVTEAGFELL